MGKKNLKEKYQNSVKICCNAMSLTALSPHIVIKNSKTPFVQKRKQGMQKINNPEKIIYKNIKLYHCLNIIVLISAMKKKI